jgi:hypothetical protein
MATRVRFFKKRKEIMREDGKPYLIRWNLFECKLFSIKLHRILMSDHDCFHDHPWSFMSIILWGGYVEHRERTAFDEMAIPGVDDEYPTYHTSKIFHPGNIIYRKATDKHKLEIHQPCTTLVVTFKKVREWGFWSKKGKFIPWYKYTPTQTCE